MQRLHSLLSSIDRAATACAILCAAVLAAWPAAAQDTPPNAAATKVIRIGAGPTGATDFPFGGLIANAISNPPGSRECERGGNCGVPGLIAVAQTTSNAADNLRALARGDLDLALSQADVTSWAYRGVGAFGNEEPLTNLRLIARLYPENVHIVVPANSPIKAVTDLKGKRVAIGAENSGTAATAKLILSAYGVKWDTVKLQNIDFIATSEALAKGTIDAAFLISGAPVLALEDLAGRMPIRLVPISGPTAEKLVQVFPFYSRGVIPPGLYGQTQTAVETIDVGSVLVARANMDPQLGYGIARALWHDRNAPLFQAGHPRGKLMDKALAAQDIGVPVLKGADRFYIENGLMAPPAGATDAARPPAAKADNGGFTHALLSRAGSR
ncbi:MAG: TAXI family TRAP transporter solute-binding subunit [Candidatus Binataceae bacterium]